MLKEFFDRLVSFCTDQAKVVPSQLTWAPDSRTVLYWDPAQKKVVTMARNVPWNRHKFLGVEDVIAYLRKLSTAVGCNPIAWVGAECIVIEANESDHTDILSMPLRFSPLWSLLKELAQKPSVPQERAIRIVRQDLSEWDIGSAALTAVRNLKIARSGEEVSEQSHVSHRLGKSVMQDAAGASQLPEYLDIQATVWTATNSTPLTVRVWLSIDFSQPGNIRFEPDLTAMEFAVSHQREELTSFLRVALADCDVQVYQGEYGVHSNS